MKYKRFKIISFIILIAILLIPIYNIIAKEKEIYFLLLKRKKEKIEKSLVKILQDPLYIWRKFIFNQNHLLIKIYLF